MSHSADSYKAQVLKEKEASYESIRKWLKKASVKSVTGQLSVEETREYEEKVALCNQLRLELDGPEGKLLAAEVRLLTLAQEVARLTGELGKVQDAYDRELEAQRLQKQIIAQQQQEAQTRAALSVDEDEEAELQQRLQVIAERKAANLARLAAVSGARESGE